MATRPRKKPPKFERTKPDNDSSFEDMTYNDMGYTRRQLREAQKKVKQRRTAEPDHMEDYMRNQVDRILKETFPNRRKK